MSSLLLWSVPKTQLHHHQRRVKSNLHHSGFETLMYVVFGFVEEELRQQLSVRQLQSGS